MFHVVCTNYIILYNDITIITLPLSQIFHNILEDKKKKTSFMRFIGNCIRKIKICVG